MYANAEIRTFQRLTHTSQGCTVEFHLSVSIRGQMARVTERRVHVLVTKEHVASDVSRYSQTFNDFLANIVRNEAR